MFDSPSMKITSDNCLHYRIRPQERCLTIKMLYLCSAVESNPANFSASKKDKSNILKVRNDCDEMKRLNYMLRKK